jgi:D-lactate dehydrogenase (cytochrome)
MIIKTDISEIQNYLVDAANYKGNCSAVYFPSSLEDITDIIKKANDEKTHVTVSGNGTGLTGGRVPEGGIVVSTEKMNMILEIIEDEKFAVVQPGVLLSDFQKEISKLNLYYPPDPTEQECFIGSTVATNASGSKSFKYGSTRNFISELEIVLPTGEVIHLKRGDVKSSNGCRRIFCSK